LFLFGKVAEMELSWVSWLIMAAGLCHAEGSRLEAPRYHGRWCASHRSHGGS
jgi:hypothetical protein